jgi:hypothetical protein
MPKPAGSLAFPPHFPASKQRQQTWSDIPYCRHQRPHARSQARVGANGPLSPAAFAGASRAGAAAAVQHASHAQSWLRRRRTVPKQPGRAPRAAGARRGRGRPGPASRVAEPSPTLLVQLPHPWKDPNPFHLGSAQVRSPCAAPGTCARSFVPERRPAVAAARALPGVGRRRPGPPTAGAVRANVTAGGTSRAGTETLGPRVRSSG